MLLLLVWNHAGFFAETISSPGCVAFSLGVRYCWHGSMCFVLPGKCHLSQGETFAACVGGVLVAWSSGACATTIQIPSLVPFLEHAVLDVSGVTCPG